MGMGGVKYNIIKLKGLALIVFIFSMNQVHAQVDPDIKFNKACSCYGVINEKGDTVVPFEFQKIEFKPYQYYQVYKIYEKHKSEMGVYNVSGEVIIPVKYNYIRFEDEFIKYSSDNETGVHFIALNKHITRPELLNFQKWENVNYSGKLFIFSGESGSEVFDFKLNLILKTEYYIHYPYPLVNHPNEYNLIFSSPDNMRLRGIMNSKGEILIPAIYSEFKGARDYNVDLVSGEEIIAINSNSYDYYPMDSKNSVYKFDYIEFWKGYAATLKDGHWNLRDKNMNSIYEDSEYALSFQTYHFDPKEFDYRNTICEGCTFYEDALMTSLNPDDNFLFRISYGKIKKNCSTFHQNCIDKYAKFGLVNFITKENTPVDYNFIVSSSKWFHWNFKKKPSSFWCIQHDKRNGTVLLDIYSRDLLKTHSYSLNDSSLFLLKYSSYPTKDSCVQLLQNVDGKFGLLNPNGSINCAFVYEKHIFLDGAYHVFGDSKHVGLYDYHGKQILPVIFDTIHMLNHQSKILVAKQEVRISIVHKDNGILLDSVSKYFEALREPVKGQSRNPYSRTNYFIKDNFLYILDYDHIELMDEKRVSFQGATLKTVNGLVIDRSGFIVSNPKKL
jgi:hypothetical protein